MDWEGVQKSTSTFPDSVVINITLQMREIILVENVSEGNDKFHTNIGDFTLLDFGVNKFLVGWCGW